MTKSIYKFAAAALFLIIILAAQTAHAAGMQDTASPLEFEQYTSYFEKNNSGLTGESSFLAFTDQKKFDKIFGAAAVMGENTFLPEKAFKSKIVVAAIRRGSSLRKYGDVKVTAENGKLYVRYSAEDGAPGSGATYSSPLIISVAKGKYKEVIFIENGKQAGSVRLRK